MTIDHHPGFQQFPRDKLLLLTSHHQYVVSKYSELFANAQGFWPHNFILCCYIRFILIMSLFFILHYLSSHPSMQSVCVLCFSLPDFYKNFNVSFQIHPFTIISIIVPSLSCILPTTFYTDEQCFIPHSEQRTGDYFSPFLALKF